MDDCTGEDSTCPCPGCVEWRDNRESEPDSQPVTIREAYEQAVREREEIG